MNFTNLISFFRIFSLPLIIYFLTLHTIQASFSAMVIFGFAMLSDMLGGFVATRTKPRKKIISSFLDPLADKVLIFGLLLFFTLSGQFSKILFSILLLRDFFSLFFRFLSSREDIQFLPRRIYAVAFTTGQFFLILGLLMEKMIWEGSLSLLKHQTLLHQLVSLLEAIVTVLAFWSLFHSLLFYTKEIRRRKFLAAEERPMPLLILANRRARGYFNSYRRRLLHIFAHRRKAKIIFFPHAVEMYTGMDEEFNYYSQIVIAGGDGSFESALNYLPLHSKTLGFFPLGAGNAFYSFFYKGKRYEYLRSRFPFKEIELDVIELEWSGGKRQTLFVNLGLDADVIRYSQDRTHHGFIDYAKGCWRSLQNAQSSYDFKAGINGRKKEFINCSTIVLGKVPYFGYGIRSLVGRVEPEDGNVYGVAVVNRHTPRLNKLLRIWALIVSMFNVSIPPLLSFRGKEIIISCVKPFPIQAGGEFLGESTWVKLKVVRKQKVLVV